MATILSFAISAFCDIIVLLICAEAVMSWFVQGFSPNMRKVYMLIRQLTDPFLMPIRKILQPIAYRTRIDFSPIAAVLLLQFIARVLVVLIFKIF